MAPPQIILDREKNKTETFCPPARTRQPADGGDARCRFIVSRGTEAGRPRCCAAPALPGSAYCARHHRRCAVSPASRAGARAIRRLEREADRTADLPPELAFLSSVAVPELDSADAPEDIAACLDFGTARDGADEDGADE
jgi:hypothetical protein